ncbi:hypothetical protein FBU59_001235 [Linderina macrospora]|uniref:Uncharacterized protein n=1 Tax=Linderina macrospora TaxID=4868 RepID=A0ACC1JEI1_9FUNG|nr:hypothetical protein FBU59_001235 [Linderina macrospora]
MRISETPVPMLVTKDGKLPVEACRCRQPAVSAASSFMNVIVTWSFDSSKSLCFSAPPPVADTGSDGLPASDCAFAAAINCSTAASSSAVGNCSR